MHTERGTRTRNEWLNVVPMITSNLWFDTNHSLDCGNRRSPLFRIQIRYINTARMASTHHSSVPTNTYICNQFSYKFLFSFPDQWLMKYYAINLYDHSAMGICRNADASIKTPMGVMQKINFIHIAMVSCFPSNKKSEINLSLVHPGPIPYRSNSYWPFATNETTKTKGLSIFVEATLSLIVNHTDRVKPNEKSIWIHIYFYKSSLRADPVKLIFHNTK